MSAGSSSKSWTPKVRRSAWPRGQKEPVPKGSVAFGAALWPTRVAMFDPDKIRSQFPALQRQVAGEAAVYLDGPAGSQVPLVVANAVRDYLLHDNANSHGNFVTSERTDALAKAADSAAVDFVGGDAGDHVAFGPNMTSLTFSFSRALARTWRAGDEIIVTRLDHDANITPWVLAARDAGVTVRRVPFDTVNTRLDIHALEGMLNARTRLVAVGAASNATGTVNPLAAIAKMAHAVGAELFVDAVHYAPHRLLDVKAWGCDYLACSAYKFFGPHIGLLWGRSERMQELSCYKLRAADDCLPDRWMTGTPAYEGLAGTLAAIDYLADLVPAEGDRRQRLTQSFAAIETYENKLCRQLIEGLQAMDGVRIHGMVDPASTAERAPTVAFSHPLVSAEQISKTLGQQGIFSWWGNYYALDVTADLGLDPEGMVRLGILHYNTASEIERLLRALRRLLPSP